VSLIGGVGLTYEWATTYYKSQGNLSGFTYSK